MTRTIGGIDLAVAVHDYDEVVRRFVLAAKNGGRADLLRRFGVQIADVLATAASRHLDLSTGPHPTVVWVPASRARRRRRGYDQGRLLARTVGRVLDLPVRPLLARSRGEAQEGRDRTDRLSGPNLRCRVSQAPDRIIVIDDVITTGASLRTAAGVLRRSGTTAVVAGAVASSGSAGLIHPPAGNAGLGQVSGLW